MTSEHPPRRAHYGSSWFPDYLEENSLLVDKTLFIKHFLEDPASVALLTRPRRWGKRDLLLGLRQIRLKNDVQKLKTPFEITEGMEVALAFCEKELAYALRPLGTTDEEEIKALAGEYYRKDPEDLRKVLTEAGKQAFEQGNLDQVRELGEPLKKLSLLKSAGR